MKQQRFPKTLSPASLLSFSLRHSRQNVAQNLGNHQKERNKREKQRRGNPLTATEAPLASASFEYLLFPLAYPPPSRTFDLVIILTHCSPCLSLLSGLFRLLPAAKEEKSEAKYPSPTKLKSRDVSRSARFREIIFLLILAFRPFGGYLELFYAWFYFSLLFYSLELEWERIIKFAGFARTRDANRT